ncbi:MAG: ribosome biogenesis GTP-binding protein YihA/YsxC, partial [Actinomycetes bacterium]
MTASPLSIEFVTSAVDAKVLPDSPAEVAFVGRSNVGKSSLINALANRKQLARVSNTPGRTQLINMFALPNGSTLVDLPGYGYAAGPRAESDAWGALIEGYLLGRPTLRAGFVRVDAE